MGTSLAALSGLSYWYPGAETPALRDASVALDGGLTVVDEDTEEKKVWQLVGEPEADAKHGKISITSPLARALIGKTKGASVEVVTPSGAKAYEVKKVEWR